MCWCNNSGRGCYSVWLRRPLHCTVQHWNIPRIQKIYILENRAKLSGVWLALTRFWVSRILFSIFWTKWIWYNMRTINGDMDALWSKSLMYPTVVSQHTLILYKIFQQDYDGRCGGGDCSTPEYLQAKSWSRRKLLNSSNS